MKIPWREYHDLTAHGVDVPGRNFQLPVGEEDGEVVLGVWHILPQPERRDGPPPGAEQMEQLLAEGSEPVVLYLHGNSFDRTTKHRVELYRILSRLQLHVVAGDYRGYGDSTGRPTEDGIVADAKSLHDYVRRVAPRRPLIVWGHSMGTGVASRLVAELCDSLNPPSALVLESPFNNLPDVINHHPFSAPFRFLPWFQALVVRPLMASGLVMNSDAHIKR